MLQWIVQKGVCMLLAAMLLLVARVASAATAPPDGFVDASVYGYDPADATAALQAALDTGSNVFVPKMATDWIVSPFFMTQSNQKLLFEAGTVLAAKSGSFLGLTDSLITAKNCSNISISGYGASFTMQKNDYLQPPYPEAQWRAGINLLHVDNAVVEGLKISNTGGDGIYVSSSTSKTADWSQDVTIKNVYIDNVYRNGISVISAKNLLIDNAVITNTNGVNPQAGIDFEPNLSDQPIQNVTVRNSIIDANNGWGVLFAVLDPRVSGTLENLTIVGNSSLHGAGIELMSPQPGVTMKDSLIVDNARIGLLGCPSADGQASGLPKDTIAYSDLWGNAGGDVARWAALGEGAISMAPVFQSTDINDPYYMYLDPSTSSLISHGASDGGYMGARPVYATPEPGTLVLLSLGLLTLLVYGWRKHK